MKVMYAEEFHAHIPLLHTDSQSGLVHSIFNNGFNIKLDDQLYFIGTDKNGSLPFGIHLQHDALRKLLENLSLEETVIWEREKQCITFLNMNYCIDLQCARTTNLFLLPAKQANAMMEKNLAPFVTILLENVSTTGLDISPETFLLQYLENFTFQNRTEQYLHRLITVAFTGGSSEIEEALRFLIGRGKGLTPSGDDLLVGMLAIAHRSGRCGGTLLEVMKQLVFNEKLTTDVGRAYLKYAIHGQFSSSVLDVISQLMDDDQPLLNRKMLRLMKMGHSSGADTLFGMLIGLLAIRRK